MSKISEIAKASKSSSFIKLNPEFFNKKEYKFHPDHLDMNKTQAINEWLCDKDNAQKPVKTKRGAKEGHFKTLYDQDKNKGISHTVKEEPSLPRKKRKNNDRSKSKRKDEQLGARFKVSITFYFADKRRRDLDGGTATILDSIVTIRRQLESSFRNPLISLLSGKY